MQLKDIDISGYDTLLLDRDGVINKLRPNDYVKCWEEFEFVPGIFEVLSKWSKHFKYIFIVTNQRGVGKGVMSEQDLLKIIPYEYLKDVNHLFMWLGRDCCKAPNPNCENCSIKKYCNFVKK